MRGRNVRIRCLRRSCSGCSFCRGRCCIFAARFKRNLVVRAGTGAAVFRVAGGVICCVLRLKDRGFVSGNVFAAAVGYGCAVRVCLDLGKYRAAVFIGNGFSVFVRNGFIISCLPGGVGYGGGGKLAAFVPRAASRSQTYNQSRQQYKRKNFFHRINSVF